MMKNVFFILAFMLISSFSFASNVEKNIDVYPENNITELPNANSDNLIILLCDLITEKTITDNETASTSTCCTVSDGHNQSIYCDGDGNMRRACRKARRKFKLEEFDDGLY